MANSQRDENRTTALGAQSSADSTYIPLEADPTTKRLRVDSVISSDDTESSFDHGRKSGISTSAVQITVDSITATRGVLIKAANGNTGTVYIGNSDVTNDTTDTTDGMELGAGESVLVKVDNANKVYVIGSVAGQDIFFLTV